MNPIYERPTSISPPEGAIEYEETGFIIDREQLSGIAATICNNIEHPITIVDFGIHDRVESTNIFHAIRTSCEAIRLCTNSELCVKCDAHHASIFSELEKGEYTSSVLHERVASLKPLDFFSHEYTTPVVHHCHDAHGKRFYIKYYCPMLGYREMFFPIIINEVIMGALFVGQFEIENEERHELIRNDFLVHRLKDIDIVKDYLSQAKKTKLKQIVERISAPAKPDYPIENIFNVQYGLAKKPRKTIITSDECDNVAQRACDELCVLERQLYSEVDKKRKTYITKNMDEIEQEFYSGFPDFSDISYHEREKTKKDFALCLQKIAHLFDFESITVYSDVNTPGMRTAGLIEYIFTNGKKCVFHNNNNIKIRADRLKPPITKPFSPRCSLDDPTVFDGFVEPIDREDRILLVYSSWAVLFAVRNINDKYYNNVYKSVFDVIESYFTSFLSAMTALHASYLQNKFELTLHMYKHECTHIAKNMGEKNSQITTDFDKLSKSKIRDLCEDMSSNILLINNIAHIIGAVVGTFSEEGFHAEYEDISIFKELLYKWGKSFEYQLAEKNVSIIVPKVSSLDHQRPFSVKTNKMLFEIILYNLVDNAVKYCYWGTNISLDFQRIFYDSRVCELTVTSYGPEVDNSRDPYKPYYRRIDKKNPIDGDGLGLYMVDQLATILDMKVNHECVKISKYNIPMIREYLNRSFKYHTKDQDLVRAIEREEGSIHAKNIRQVINFTKTDSISDIDLAEEDIVNDICKSTYKTTFKLEIVLS